MPRHAKRAAAASSPDVLSKLKMETYGQSLTGKCVFVVVSDDSGQAPPSTLWTLTLENGRVVSATAEHRSLLNDEKHSIDLVCSLPESGWHVLSVAAPNDVPRVLEELDPGFSGHLSFFIRHLESLLKVIVMFSRVVA